MTDKDERGEVTLLVSNQSFDVNPVDIKVSIDGQIVVDADFDVEGDQPPQHNWRRYNLQLENGTHSLVAESKKGKTLERVTLDVSGPHSVTIAYWHGNRSPGSDLEGFFTIENGPHGAATM